MKVFQPQMLFRPRSGSWTSWFLHHPPQKYPPPGLSARIRPVVVDPEASQEFGQGFHRDFVRVPAGGSAMAENLSQSELDYPFKLLEYFNGFRVSKVTFPHTIQIDSLHRAFWFLQESILN